MENLISSSYRNFFLLGSIFLLKTEIKEFSTKMKKLKMCHENVIDHAIIKNTYGKKTFSLLNIMIIQMKELLAFYYA